MSRLANRLLKWYGENKRALPWRGHPDPYAIWISEIMLQQTRVEAVIPYFERWMSRFPTVAALARASEQQVLKAWEGLGYYTRARNLRRAAQAIMDEHNGQLPDGVDELRRLPGIGRYTAGAIASIAFGRDEAALDGNIRRVLSRVFNVAEPVDLPAGERLLWELAEHNLPKGHAGDYNQALMDLGATICVPLNPRCPACPVNALCEARKLGMQNERPVTKARSAVPHYVHAAAVVVRRGRVLLAQRPSQGLLGGMWEFPNVRLRSLTPRSVSAAFRKQYGLELRCGERLGTVHHGYSHFSVEVHAFRCTMDSVLNDHTLRWISVRKLDELPMGRIDRQIASKLV
jgi:A/G-specific adenine glycosylase